MEATQVSMDGWMDKQVWYIHTMEYYSALKREENYDTCYNMDECRRHYGEWNKPVTRGQIRYDSLTRGTWSSQIHRDREWNGDFWALGELPFHWFRVIGKMRHWRWKRVMDTQQCDVLNASELCTGKWLKSHNLCYVYSLTKIFFHRQGCQWPSFIKVCDQFLVSPCRALSIIWHR